jgi:AcrR family transcriptional regulator
MEAILEKYFETIRKLFLEIGIKSITMDDICSKLGISKKTFISNMTIKTN